MLRFTGETLTCAAGVLDLSQVRGAVEVGEGELGQVFILSDGRRVDVDGRLPAAVAEVSSDSRPQSVIYGNEWINQWMNQWINANDVIWKWLGRVTHCRSPDGNTTLSE